VFFWLRVRWLRWELCVCVCNGRHFGTETHTTPVFHFAVGVYFFMPGTIKSYELFYRWCNFAQFCPILRNFVTKVQSEFVQKCVTVCLAEIATFVCVWLCVLEDFHRLKGVEGRR
jgi:hypothetical protein